MTGKELKRIIDNQKLKIAEIVEKSGIPKRTLYNLYDKESVEEHYLEDIRKAGVEVPKSAKRGVPVFNGEFTGGDVTLFQDDQAEVIGYVDLEGFRMCKGFVRIRGNSMYPTFTAGDFVGLEPDEDLSIIEYGMPYGIVTKTNKRLLKIIRKGKDDEHLILRSVNPDFDDINIHKDKILKLFRVHGPVRDIWQ